MYVVLKVVDLEEITKRISIESSPFFLCQLHLCHHLPPHCFASHCSKTLQKIVCTLLFPIPTIHSPLKLFQLGFYLYRVVQSNGQFLSWQFLAIRSIWHPWSHPFCLLCFLHLAGIPHSWFSFNLTGYSFLDFFTGSYFFSRINPVLVLFLFSIYIYSLDNLFQIHDFKYHPYANESQFISLNQTSFLNSRPV